MSPDAPDGAFLDPEEMADTYWHLVGHDGPTQPFELHITNGPQNTEFI